MPRSVLLYARKVSGWFSLALVPLATLASIVWARAYSSTEYPHQTLAIELDFRQIVEEDHETIHLVRKCIFMKPQNADKALKVETAR